MNFCSDITNLQSLYGPDRSAAPRAQAAAARERVQTITQQLDRLTDAMLASSEEGTPLAFARKARQLEADLAQAQAQVTQAEAELASTSRSSTAAKGWPRKPISQRRNQCGKGLKLSDMLGRPCRAGKVTGAD